jgi:L-ascorbate metabolism protein UlaG (beta-lactamase superfamily)
MRTRYAFSLTLPLALAAGAACTPNASPPPTPGSSQPAVRPAPSAPSPSAAALPPAAALPSDVFPTSAGELRVTPIHHGTLRFDFGGKIIYVDPTAEAKVAGMPKADFVFITDIHPDHFDPTGLYVLRKRSTVIVAPPVVAEKVNGALVMKNGETHSFDGFSVEAVPMYNRKRGPAAGQFYHDKGRGNGYVMTFGGKRAYLSGDTECIDEMKALKDIDVAFVCMNLPYTMPPAEAAECVKAFRPKVVYPYHYRGSDLEELTKPLAGEKGIEVRLRDWY